MNISLHEAFSRVEVILLRTTVVDKIKQIESVDPDARDLQFNALYDSLLGIVNKLDALTNATRESQKPGHMF